MHGNVYRHFYAGSKVSMKHHITISTAIYYKQCYVLFWATRKYVYYVYLTYLFSFSNAGRKRHACWWLYGAYFYRYIHKQTAWNHSRLRKTYFMMNVSNYLESVEYLWKHKKTLNSKTMFCNALEVYHDPFLSVNLINKKPNTNVPALPYQNKLNPVVGRRNLEDLLRFGAWVMGDYFSYYFKPGITELRNHFIAFMVHKAKEF